MCLGSPTTDRPQNKSMMTNIFEEVVCYCGVGKEVKYEGSNHQIRIIVCALILGGLFFQAIHILSVRK